MSAALDALLLWETPSYVSALFAQQRAFVRDKARFKNALCGRRAGKTESVCTWLIDGAVSKPGTRSVYVALSQKNARRLIWETLRRVCLRNGIRAEFNEQTLECRLGNGSIIWASGCPARAQCEDFRGHFYWRVAIDEAGSFTDWLEYLVEDVFRPALLDLRGELAMVGSPGLRPVGYFYDRTEGERAWPTHRWTCLDNPFVGGARELAELKDENKWDDDHPTYVREWLGRWVRDDSSLVYPFDPMRNLGTMPEGEGKVVRVLSVDLGFEDPCAFVIGDSRMGQPEWYGVKAWRRYKLIPAGIAAEIEQARHQCRLEGRPIDRIVVDCGALGKSISEDLRQTYGIAHEAAEKRDKLVAIHGFRGALLSGTAKIAPLACQQLREEWITCAWNETRTDHSELCADDLCDSAIYNFRAHGLHYTRELNPPSPESPEGRAAHKAMRLKALDAERRSKRRSG